MAPIYVVGHKNPDTDSVAAAIGYAWLLRQRDGEDALPARAGSLRPQTEFALKHFGIEAPMLLEDASPRFRAIADSIKPLAPDSPLSEAWRQSAVRGRVMPVVDEQGRPVGMVTSQSVFNYLSKRLDLADRPFRDLIGVPAGEACDPNVPRFNANDRISDYRDRIFNVQYDDFWVVDGDGKYVGTCRRADMMQPPRMRLVMVDHNEPSQAVNGLEEAELLEVLDHHRLATINTSMPISFYVSVVGSTSTLVSERMRLARLNPPPDIAGMLLSGLLSDTLVFTSPTTTQRDRMSGLWLAWMTFGVDKAEQQMHEYGEELLRAGADVSGQSAQEMIRADMKEFEAGRVSFSVSQIEVTSFMPVLERVGEIRQSLVELCEQRGHELAALMVTDITTNNSILIAVGPAKYLERLPFSRKGEGIWDMPGIVSRKKQLLPTLLGVLQG
ncbi:MAG: DHHA2 domain-containing protein [Candidatus Roseilinea sp.]|uniref:DHHA2 domain-containing protein n=1 Tax=Candidatus Roseilinea sp. TaxID=2838777 RepID=UPI0040496511